MGIRIDHIGIATNNLEDVTKFWKILGLVQGDDETNEEQGVNIRFFETEGGKSPRIELLDPTGSDTPIGKFIENRGPGIQQIAFEVRELQSLINRLMESGIRMINESPVAGAHDSSIAFVHPSSTGGVLVELVEYAE